MYACVAGRGAQRSAQVVDNVDSMASSVDEAERRSGRLASSYYALIAWVAVVTATLVVVAVVTARRRARRLADDQSADAGSLSSASRTSPATIDAVERCAAPLDQTLPEVAEVTTASDLGGDASATVCDDGPSGSGS